MKIAVDSGPPREEETSALAHVLESWPFALVFLSHDKELVAANRSARRFAAHTHLFELTTHLRWSDMDDSRKFDESWNAESAAPQWFVTTGSAAAACVVCVRRTPFSPFPGIVRSPGVVTIWPRRLRRVGSARLLQGAFGLTDAETRLVVALFDSLNLSLAAKRSGVTYSTARSYLKRIFMKTGTRRQPELVALLSAVAVGTALDE